MTVSSADLTIKQVLRLLQPSHMNVKRLRIAGAIMLAAAIVVGWYLVDQLVKIPPRPLACLLREEEPPYDCLVVEGESRDGYIGPDYPIREQLKAGLALDAIVAIFAIILLIAGIGSTRKDARLKPHMYGSTFAVNL